mmetsp:Transcript_7086/g.8196  ORF Transcript_7086/g.8196 Transcript_7086/m.8196 type:complete len:229 (-) Transcript_7086:847-1533(-)
MPSVALPLSPLFVGSPPIEEHIFGISAPMFLPPTECAPSKSTFGFATYSTTADAAIATSSLSSITESFKRLSQNSAMEINVPVCGSIAISNASPPYAMSSSVVSFSGDADNGTLLAPSLVPLLLLPIRTNRSILRQTSSSNSAAAFFSRANVSTFPPPALPIIILILSIVSNNVFATDQFCSENCRNVRPSDGNSSPNIRSVSACTCCNTRWGMVRPCIRSNGSIARR